MGGGWESLGKVEKTGEKVGECSKGEGSEGAKKEKEYKGDTR